MSNPNGVVCGIDEARHGDSVQRLGGVMIVVEASVEVEAAGAWSLGHRDMADVSTVVGGAAGAGTSTGDAGTVVGNGDFDERRKESRPRSN